MKVIRRLFIVRDPGEGRDRKAFPGLAVYRVFLEQEDPRVQKDKLDRLDRLDQLDLKDQLEKKDLLGNKESRAFLDLKDRLAVKAMLDQED